MRLLPLFSGLCFASNAGAAGIAGPYVLQGQQGPIVAKIEVRGTTLTGSFDLAGQGTMKLTGTVTGNRARGAVSSIDGTGTLEAAVEGDILDLTIAQGDGPNQRVARLPLQFQRLQPGAATKPPPAATKDGTGGERLASNWVYQNIIVIGDASSFILHPHMHPEGCHPCFFNSPRPWSSGRRPHPSLPSPCGRWAGTSGTCSGACR